MLVIGIDPGVSTGYAEWHVAANQLMVVETLAIHRAMDMALLAKRQHFNSPSGGLLVIVEDARQRTWFGGADARQRRSGAGIREGVGSVKRDCGIWDDFLTDHGIPHVMQHPGRSSTKRTAAWFKQLTGWQARCSEHARDAALLVYGMDENRIKVMQGLLAAKAKA